MGVDVLTEVVIDRPVLVVAEYVADPSNAPEWYANIESVGGRPSCRSRSGRGWTSLRIFWGGGSPTPTRSPS